LFEIVKFLQVMFVVVLISFVLVRLCFVVEAIEVSVALLVELAIFLAKLCWIFVNFLFFVTDFYHF